MNDDQVISFLENSQGNQIKSLSESAPTEEVRALFSRLDYLVQNGQVRQGSGYCNRLFGPVVRLSKGRR